MGEEHNAGGASRFPPLLVVVRQPHSISPSWFRDILADPLVQSYFSSCDHRRCRLMVFPENTSFQSNRLSVCLREGCVQGRINKNEAESSFS